MRFVKLSLCTVVLILGLTSIQPSSAAADFGISGISMGLDYSKLIDVLPKNKEGKTSLSCKAADSKPGAETCWLNNCQWEDPKCKLWGAKSLMIAKATVSLTNKKVTRFKARLDSELKNQDVRKIIEALEAKLGVSTNCPIKAYVNDQEKKRPEFYCEWKSKDNMIVLESDDNQPVLVLKSTKDE